MNNQDTIPCRSATQIACLRQELFTEWVNANQEKIRFAAWLKTLSEADIDAEILRIRQNINSRCEDAPCCGCCE